MKKYIGTKQVEAEPMNMGQAYEKGFLQAGRVPSKTEQDKPGYHVKYADGYESWYPAEPFEAAYRDISGGMDFGDAVTLLKAGSALRRKGWNGKGLFVVKQVPAHIEGDVIPKMQSLPQYAKELILKGKGFIDYTSQCLIYNENTGRADSWVPSISDVFAEDWEIVQ
ncbi:DUF2829 domain-containing protein [uncultured Bacteroides sp.]|uniref:DUF2829 domain-containing protein n=1 Tax=uncultured Bacteroides sp. TaxID=162156 RepID=UPI002607FFBB|nr:DUF2829 domain-containing protein [uncultured Bacteroides sp.]